MLKLNKITSKIQNYNPQTNINLIKKAYIYSEKVHTGQMRKSGEPYLSHPIEVAEILIKLKLDDASICTALLHDTMEDTFTSKGDIEHLFGGDIAKLVDGVTKLSQIQFKSNEEKQAENFRKMLVAMSRDIRVLLVKLADRLHNMRTLQFMEIDKQKKISLETIEIYAPLANRLGIGWLKMELEDLSFKYLKSKNYKELKIKIGQTKKNRAKFTSEVSDCLYKSLSNAGMNNFEVSGRPKHLWSIYSKMIEKALIFEEINDLIAFRILVNTLGECYEALGHIHSLWKPIPGRFKDYIAMPKPNGYRSLHTIVLGPNGNRIEVQIRSIGMHNIAESGIAAHWKYKENNRNNQFENTSESGFVWLRQLMDWQRTLKDPNEFLDSVKVDLFTEETYVFTPQGEVIELPKGATPVDFAFAIHSDLGTKCFSAKVNNFIVPLKYVLKSGDSCVIVTKEEQSPKKEWLEFVKTSKARTKIRALMRQQEIEQSRKIGKELLEREFKKHSISLQKFLNSTNLDDLLKSSKYRTIDEIFIALAYGKIDSQLAGEILLPVNIRKKNKIKEKKNQFIRIIKRIFKRSKSGIKIEGIENILVHYALCCTAIKGDPIIGYITRGRGLTIHRRNCTKVMELDSERRINVSWDYNSKFIRSISIQVFTNDREGMLTDLSATFAILNINISEAKCKVLGDGNAINTFKCGIGNLDQLKKIIKSLESVKNVHSVDRIHSID